MIYFIGHGSSYPVTLINRETDSNEKLEQEIEVCDQKLPISTFCENLYQNNSNLKLVILSCCEGLDVAKNLLKEGIPQIIFMREKITPKTSRYFLEYFLEEFSKEPCLHIALHNAQFNLSAENADGIGLGSSEIMALLQLPNSQHLEWHPPDKDSHPNIFQKVTDQYDPKIIFSVLTLSAFIFLGMGFLSKQILHQSPNPPRINDALRYTLDIYVVERNPDGVNNYNKSNRNTAIFLDKQRNPKTHGGIFKRYTYTILVSPELIEDIQEGQMLEIHTPNGETIDIANLNNYALENTPDYLTLSFESDEEYQFPEFNAKGLFQKFLFEKDKIALIADNNVVIYKRDLETKEIFGTGTIGKLVGRYSTGEIELGEPRYIYYGYVLDPKFIEYINRNKNAQNSGNLFEIHTFKDEKFLNYKNNISLVEDSQGNFNYLPEKSVLFFSFSTNKKYEFTNVFTNIKNLDYLKEQYYSNQE
ncbi:CHAT domain-containing protein [Crocosphaera watsonii]|nr:CHAT domain-containing protein [Crocosphaera watsonii]